MPGPRPRPGRVEKGVVVHFEAKSETVVDAAADLIKRLGEIVGVAGNTQIAVATRKRSVSPTRSFMFRDASTSRLRKYCDSGEPFYTGALGDDRLDVHAAPMESGAWTLSVTAASAHTPDTPLHSLDRITECCASLGNGLRFVSGGADVGPRFDPQEQVVFPLNRGGSKWREILERNVACGYYWLTLLGEETVGQLGPPPDELPVARTGDITYVRLAESPEQDSRIRELIPSLRAWMQPVLAGWMVGLDPGFEARLYEGPVVPTAVAYVLSSVAEGRTDHAMVATEVELAFNHSGWASGCDRILVELAPTSTDLAKQALEGLVGTVSAVERGRSEGWFEHEPFGDLTVRDFTVEAQAPQGTLQLLLYALHYYLDAHTTFTKAGPIPMARLVKFSMT